VAMNLKAMAVYCKVVERGVMAHAAAELEMTPAAVTRIIAELEQELGVRLINRTTRKLHLTDTGRHYYEACQQLLEQASEMHDRFATLATIPAGRLRISAPMSFGQHYLPDVIAAFRSEYPAVDITLHLDDRVVDLVEEGFDLAIRIRRDMKDSTLVTRVFAEFELMIVCAPSFLERHASISTPGSLKGLDCLSYSLARSPRRWHFRNKAGKAAVHAFIPTLEANSSIFLKRVVLSGQGVCSLPSFLVEQEIRSGQLVRLLPNWHHGTATGWLVYPGRKLNAPALTCFVDFMQRWYTAR